MKLAIKNLSHRSLPRLKFREIAEYILDQNYDLSLVFVGPERSRKLNHIWRDKNKPANILSFSLDQTAGEIFIDLKSILMETRQNHQPFNDYLLFIFIHGLLHLKGLDHGSKMETLESQLVKHFLIS